MKLRTTALSVFLLALLLPLHAARAAPTNVDVDNIWDDGDAKGKCERACTDKSLYWTGKWGKRGWMDRPYCMCDSHQPRPQGNVPIVILPGTPGAPAAAIVGSPVIRYEQTDFMFGDIARVDARSFEECAQHCMSESRCVAFTRSQAGSCYLKSGTGNVQHNFFATSGFLSARGNPPPQVAVAAPPPPPPAAAVPSQGDGVPAPNTVPATGALRWVPSGSGQALPADAVAGGSEDGATLYVCRAAHSGGVHPGKIVKGNCNIAYGGREIYMHGFEVLAGPGARWGAAQPGMTGAFVAGAENNKPLYLCQADYRGGQHPGKVINGKCDISYGGEEVPVVEFRVLYTTP